jgi:formate-dependent nitrite reductase membrane component NrfD
MSSISFVNSIAFLCLPVYLAYPMVGFKALGNFDLSTINSSWWTANIIFSVAILPLCIWLYMQVSYKNIHKKWVKFIIEKSGGNTIRKAMEFTKEIDDIKKESLELERKP